MRNYFDRVTRCFMKILKDLIEILKENQKISINLMKNLLNGRKIDETSSNSSKLSKKFGNFMKIRCKFLQNSKNVEKSYKNSM